MAGATSSLEVFYRRNASVVDAVFLLVLVLLCSSLGIQDSDGRREKMPPYYRVECLVPFKSQCHRSRAEVQKLLLEKRLSVTGPSSTLYDAFRKFVPVVIERPFEKSELKKAKQAWIDLVKSEALTGWLKTQLDFYGKDDASSFATRLAEAYLRGDLHDCCEGRRPRYFPVSYLGGTEFSLWGLSAQQSCRENVCPIAYRWDDDWKVKVGSATRDGEESSDSPGGGSPGGEEEDSNNSNTTEAILLYDQFPESLSLPQKWTLAEEKSLSENPPQPGTKRNLREILEILASGG